MREYHFCTYFDRNYLSRGLALYASLRDHCPSFHLHVLCMDKEAFEILSRMNLPDLRPIALPELERNDTGLLEAKNNRSLIEYYFTCTAALPLYIMSSDSSVDLITYLDADLFFFSDPEPLFAELGTGSVGIVGHRFPPHLRDREKYGLYNVGWLSFRRDAAGIECLEWWRARCIEWCYDRVEAGRFADQKYLDDWPVRFRNVVTLTHPGANLAPWNLGNHSIGIAGGTVSVDSKPLIFFHFHGLKQIGRWLYNPGWKEYAVPPSELLRDRIYLPYIRVLRRIALWLTSYTSRELLPAGVRRSSAERDVATFPRRVLKRLRRARQNTREIIAGELILCFSSGPSPVTAADHA